MFNKILFLDMDGVICIDSSSEEFVEHISKEKIKLLNNIVEQTNCYIVITSQNRITYNTIEFQKMFLERGFLYSDRIIDTTPEPYLIDKSKNIWSKREDEIQRWLDNHCCSDDVKAICILDDDGFKETQFDIKTDFYEGLVEKQVILVVKTLNE